MNSDCITGAGGEGRQGQVIPYLLDNKPSSLKF